MKNNLLLSVLFLCLRVGNIFGQTDIIINSNTHTTAKKIAIGNDLAKGDISYFKGKPFTGHFYDIYSEKILNKCNCYEEAEYLNGVRNGLFIEYFPTGKINRQCNYDAGKKSGLQTEWYENGQMKSETLFANDELFGTQNIWFENGQKKSESTFANNKLYGTLTTWFENGQKEKEEIYDLGGLVKKIEFYSSGINKSENNFTNEQFNGTQTLWYENGQKKSEFNFSNEKPNGVNVYWYENNQKQKEELYENGILLKFTEWTLNGAVKKTMAYENGKIKDGDYISTDENGVNTIKKTYLNGIITEEFTSKGGSKTGKLIKWYDNKNKKFEGEYQNGKRNGALLLFDESGKKICEGNYSNGLKDGKFSFFENGKLLYEEHFKSDIAEGEIIWYYQNGNKVYQGFQNNSTNLKYTFWDDDNKKIFEH